MSVLGTVAKVGLTTAFMLAADMAFAATTGMVGVHGLIVDAGAQAGLDWGVPQLKWSDLLSGEINFIDPNTDPCLIAGGHYHGDFCHYESHGAAAPVISAPPVESTYE